MASPHCFLENPVYHSFRLQIAARDSAVQQIEPLSARLPSMLDPGAACPHGILFILASMQCCMRKSWPMRIGVGGSSIFREPEMWFRPKGSSHVHIICPLTEILEYGAAAEARALASESGNESEMTVAKIGAVFILLFLEHCHCLQKAFQWQKLRHTGRPCLVLRSLLCWMFCCLGDDQS